MYLSNYPALPKPDKSELNCLYVTWEACQPTEQQVMCEKASYCTQIAKCNDRSYCKKPQSSFFDILHSHFLPAPFPLIQTSEGLKAAEPGSESDMNFTTMFLTQSLSAAVLPRSVTSCKRLPYDAYCPSPSVQSVIKCRLCKTCGLYHASLTSLKNHTRHVELIRSCSEYTQFVWLRGGRENWWLSSLMTATLRKLNGLTRSILMSQVIFSTLFHGICCTCISFVFVWFRFPQCTTNFKLDINRNSLFASSEIFQCLERIENWKSYLNVLIIIMSLILSNKLIFFHRL